MDLVLDLDGVLCEETGRHDDYVDRKPLSDQIAALKRIRHHFRHVILFTARYPEDFWITVGWLEKHGLVDLITCVQMGKPQAFAYVDDKSKISVCDLEEVLNAKNNQS